MPLSEHEQQVLDELERTLLLDDPDLANTLRAGPPTPVGTYVLGGLGLLVGLGVLVLGVALEQIIVGVVGFLLMFASVAFALTKAARAKARYEAEDGYAIGSDTVTANVAPSKQRVRASGSRENFMSRVEERWERRNQTQ